MTRTAPVMPNEVPGNFNTAALYGATTAAVGTWQGNPPRFRGYATTTQAIATGITFVPLTLDSEFEDPDGGHSAVTNTSRFVCQVAGGYWLQGSVALPVNGTGNRSIQLGVNGVTVPGTTLIQAAPTGNSWMGSVSAPTRLAVGDYVEVFTWQTSGVSLNTNVGSGLQPTLSALWISN